MYEKHVIKETKPLLYISKKEIIAYEKGKLIVYSFQDGFDKVLKESSCAIPMSYSNKICSRFRILERTLRLSPRTIEMVNAHQFIFGYKGAMLCYDLDTLTIKEEFRFPNGMSSPLNISKVVGNSTIKDGLYCGQYSENMEKKVVKIWRRRLDEPGFEEVYEFAEDTIHHIHNIIPDKNNEFVYILTGDDDIGSGIWKAYNDFSRVEPLLVGSQEYRACLLFELGDRVIYCTDTPMNQNYVCSCVFENNKLKIVDKYDIPGTVIYGDCDGKDILVGTTVEPDSLFDNCGKLKKILESKLGEGIQDRYVHIIRGNSEDGFREIAQSKKDWLPMRLCQFGSAQFPKYAFSKYGKVTFSFEATVDDNKWITMEE